MDCRWSWQGEMKMNQSYQATPFDLVLAGGRIVDGSGQPSFAADLGIRNRSIASIGSLGDAEAKRRIDISGLTAAPGFIDIHTHSDISLLLNPVDEPRLSQGVTTVVFSNCGIGFAPVTDESLEILKRAYAGIFGRWRWDHNWRSVKEYLDNFSGRTSLNVAYLLPYGAVRVAVMGMAAREATSRETLGMLKLVKNGMEAGALGLSLGLNYAPMCYAQRQEIVAIIRGVKEYGGFVAIHLRDYFEGLVQALQEALDLAEFTGVPVQISHLQAAGRSNWGKAELLLSMIDEARERGSDVTLDSYPYMAGSTILHAFLPPWAQEGGPEEILKRLREDHTRSKIATQMAAANVDWNNVVITGLSTSGNAVLVGRSVHEIAQKRGVSETRAICQLLVEEELEASFVYHHGNEQDVGRIMQHPLHMIGSDGIQSGQMPHPRLYGSFARYLGRFIREKRLLTLESAVRKITSLPASRLGLVDRGQLKEGMVADIAVFDPRTIRDQSTFEEPCQIAQGMELVIVNGEIASERAGTREELSGQLLLQPS